MEAFASAGKIRDNHVRDDHSGTRVFEILAREHAEILKQIHHLLQQLLELESGGNTDKAPNQSITHPPAKRIRI